MGTVEDEINGALMDALGRTDKPVARFQGFLQRTELAVDAKTDAVKNIINAAESHLIKNLKEQLPLQDFPLSKVIRIFEDFNHDGIIVGYAAVFDFNMVPQDQFFKAF